MSEDGGSQVVQCRSGRLRISKAKKLEWSMCGELELESSI